MLKVSGFTLIELSIALLISSSFILFATSAAMHIGEGLTRLKQQALLKNEARLLIQTVSIQIKRAGYVAQSFNEVLSHSAQFPGSVVIGNHPSSPANSCVLFSYDKNSDGGISAQLPAEMLGFRLHNHALEYRVDQKSCEQGGWHDMNNTKEFAVTLFSIQPYAIADLAQIYKIDLALESKFDSTLSVQRTLLLRVPNAF